MRPTNFPSASSAVAWTRGTPLCTSTVSEGCCAPAGGEGPAAAHASRARRRNPALTSEAMVESQRESQWLTCGDRLRHVQAEPAPVDAHPEIPEPAPERRQPVARQPARAAADEPPLAGVAQHHEIGAPQREQRFGLLVFRLRGMACPMHRDVAPVT